MAGRQSGGQSQGRALRRRLRLPCKTAFLNSNPASIFDPKQSSPLADLLTTRAAPSEVLYFTPRDSLLTLNLNLNDGDSCWAKLMNLIDSLTKPSAKRGGEATVAAALHELEGSHKAESRQRRTRQTDERRRDARSGSGAWPDGHVVTLLMLQASDSQCGRVASNARTPFETWLNMSGSRRWPR